MNEIKTSLSKLRQFIEGERFAGYDPYDALTGRLDFSRLGKWGPVLAIQFQKRNPINIRPILGVEKGHNPKGMGLLLQAYSILHAENPSDETRATAEYLFRWLRNHSSEGYSGYCWGYNFDWASPVKYLKAYTPSVVVTSFVCRGIHAYYQATSDPDALVVLRSACDFVLTDLPRVELSDGVCISYTPVMKDCCYNASMLGAELLARVYSLTAENELLEIATEAADFCVARQHQDGKWNYSLDVASGREREQIDFHQGFILDSLHAFIAYAEASDRSYSEAVRRGAAFYYNEQFDEDGRAKWRLPKEYPTDIHCQAQGIITFSKLADLDAAYLPFAHRIAQWAVSHMQDAQGFFYYRRGRLITNKIPYMRWGQAWMMVALCELIGRSNRAAASRMGTNATAVV